MKRLSPYNVDHPLIRASLYREVMTESKDDAEYEVSLDELRMPELIAQRYHATPDTKLLVAVSAQMQTLRQELRPAQLIKLKSTPEIRASIRKYEGMENVLESLNDGF